MARYFDVVQIALDSMGLEGQIAKFERAGNNINESTSSVLDPSQCRGLVLSDWVDRVRDIGELIALYKELVEKDVVSLRDAQKAIEDADKDRADNILDGVMDPINSVTKNEKNKN